MIYIQFSRFLEKRRFTPKGFDPYIITIELQLTISNKKQIRTGLQQSSGNNIAAYEKLLSHPQGGDSSGDQSVIGL